MRSPIFSPRQFLDPTTLNTSFSTVLNGVADAFGYSTTSQGLLNPSALSFSSSGLNLTVTANPPFAILFGNGIVAPFLGMSSGSTTNSVTLNLSSYVPSTGSQTVYIIGTPIQISLDPTIIYGPPIGDPNYSTLFSPTQAYTTSAYSIGVSATTTAPNNSSQMELGRLTLSAGATTLPAVDTAYQPLVSFSITNTAIIDTLGYVPLSNGIFSSANTWTGSNNFTGGLSISGYPFSLSSPSTNDVLYWNGTDFVVGPDPILALNNTWSGTNTFTDTAYFSATLQILSGNLIMATPPNNANNFISQFLAQNNIGGLFFTSASGSTDMDTISWRRDTSLGYAMSVVNENTNVNYFYIDSSSGDSTFIGSVTVGGLSISGYPFSLFSPSTNDVLYWNGTDFVVGPDPILALNNTWTGLNNFTGGLSISGYPFSLSSPATNDVLYWNGTDFVVGPDPILALNNTWSGTTNTFDGSVTAQSFNTSSSLAIKSDVSDLGTETAEDFIQNLRPVTFRYKEHLDDGKEHVGLIAEEVSHINPAFAPNGKSVSYAEITATLIKTVQTLMKRVDELSQKLEGRLP
jgi:hypothetical protein